MITILKPTPEDAEEINEVIKKSWYDTYISKDFGITREDIDRMYIESEKQQIEMFRKRAMEQKDDDISLVAKDAKSIVGFIRLKINTEESQLLSLYILPEYAGKGVGTKLWLEALPMIPQNRPITTEVATYTRAKDFYKKIGFVDMGDEYRNQGDPMLSSGRRIPLMKMVLRRCFSNLHRAKKVQKLI